MWLERWTDGSSRQWIVLSPAAARIGTLTLPKNVALKAVDGRTLWGVELDEDDVPTVVRYDLTP